MDAKVTLPYGSGEIEFDVKGAASIETILPNHMNEITDVESAFTHAVEDEAIGGVTLKDAIKADDTCVSKLKTFDIWSPVSRGLLSSEMRMEQIRICI